MTRNTPIGTCDTCKQPIFWNERVSASLIGMSHHKCADEGVPVTDRHVEKDDVVPPLDPEEKLVGCGRQGCYPYCPEKH